MRLPDPAVPYVDAGIAGAEADGLLIEQNRLPGRAGGEKLAPPDLGVRVHQVAIEGERGLVFGNRFVEAVLRTEQLALGQMCLGIIGRSRETLSYQLLSPFDVGSSRPRHLIEHAAG